MKTFEEAFQIVVKDKDKLETNVKSLGILPQTHEAWANHIKIQATLLLENILQQRDVPIVCACTALHIAFDIGLLVGIEMEKQSDYNPTNQ